MLFLLGGILKQVEKFDSVEDDELYNDSRNIVIHKYVQIEGDCEQNENRLNGARCGSRNSDQVALCSDMVEDKPCPRY